MSKSNLFDKRKTYTFDEISKIAEQNGLAIIDCLKDENIISLEGYNGKDLSGDNLFEFNRISEDVFKLKWFELYWYDMI